MVHGFDGLGFDDFFKFSNVTRTRGHRFKLKIKRSRLDVRKYLFSQRVADEWNGLPESVVTSASVNSFKNSLDKFFRSRGRVF